MKLSRTAVDLQQYINSASAEEKEKLKEYEVSIDMVESYRSQQKLDKPLSADQKQRYLYDIKQIDWNIISKVGLSKEKLENAGAMESLLKGYKTPMLLPIAFSLGSTTSHMEARLSLVPNITGTLEIRFHPIRKDYDFSKPFYGHHFTKEDQSNLIQNGNMGRVVDLIHPITGKKTSSLISRDRLTNELIPLSLEFVKIPLVIKGVTLDAKQQQTLKEGKPLYIENMLSKKGTLFNAYVQFNTDKHFIEFLFKKKKRNSQINLKISVLNIKKQKI